MTNEEFVAYLNTLPPETRALVLARVKHVAEYAARASRVRRNIQQQFPGMNPRLRAALSLVIARFA